MITYIVLLLTIAAFIVAVYARHRVLNDPAYKRPGYLHDRDDQRG